MYLIDTQLSANQVLRAFHRDEPYLFLGAAFTTVAVVSAAFCLLRRRFDALLIFLALFAFFYGQRLWLEAEVLRISLPDNEFFQRLQAAVNYLVPIPAFFFFQASGLLGRKGRIVTSTLALMFAVLVAATMLFGARPEFQYINNALVILALPAIALRSHLMRKTQPDAFAIRIGLLCFVLGALWDNIARALRPLPRVEPFCFAVLLGSLGYVAARHILRRDHELDEMRSELETARRIQLSILPGAFPESAYFRVAARYVPMTTVAGDFYDFVSVSPTQAGILIADVSGHGIPAALIASMVKMAASSQRANSTNPAQLLDGMNTALCGNTQDQSVTAAYVHLDAQAREFRYAAAGHPPMLLLRNGHVSEVIENGLVMAITATATYTQITQPLKEGDRLIIYTDGILEARDAQGKFYDEENLHAIIARTATLPPSEAANQVVDSVQEWSKSQDDDLTMIVCDFTTDHENPTTD